MARGEPSSVLHACGGRLARSLCSSMRSRTEGSARPGALRRLVPDLVEQQTRGPAPGPSRATWELLYVEGCPLDRIWILHHACFRDPDADPQDWKIVSSDRALERAREYVALCFPISRCAAWPGLGCRNARVGRTALGDARSTAGVGIDGPSRIVSYCATHAPYVRASASTTMSKSRGAAGRIVHDGSGGELRAALARESRGARAGVGSLDRGVAPSARGRIGLPRPRLRSVRVPRRGRAAITAAPPASSSATDGFARARGARSAAAGASGRIPP